VNKELSEALADCMLKMTDRAVDPSLKMMVRKWSQPAKAVQILESLDWAVHGSLCSSFEIKAMEFALEEACKRERVTRSDLEGIATWRR
jgi:hypothetical protein